ncbi:hypothetical protein AAIH46_03035 [Rhizobium sp. 0TCS1.26]|uniref:hypothetical protein n=1 Tax=Rhizobium sp. 0TCS1.26 TaxID=3142623 RepID=UPI003D2D438D
MMKPQRFLRGVVVVEGRADRPSNATIGRRRYSIWIRLLDCEDDYGKAVFGRDQFEKIALVLGRLRGSFILPLTAVEGVFKTFSTFATEETAATQSKAKGVAPLFHIPTISRVISTAAPVARSAF